MFGRYIGKRYFCNVLHVSTAMALANVYVAPGFAVKLGLQPGFNVNSKAKAKNNGVSVEADMDAKTVDLSIPIGLSYEFSNFVIDGRYNWGVTKVARTATARTACSRLL